MFARALVLSILIMPSSAVAAGKFTLNCDTLEECQAKLDAMRQASSPRRSAPSARVPDLTNEQARAQAPQSGPPRTEVKVFVRKSMEDLGSFTKPGKLADATGALFSWSRDYVKDNDLWSAQGLLGMRFLYWGDPQSSTYLSHGSFASYVQFDRQWNSLLTTNDVDDLTIGGAGEVAVANLAGATHYVRAKGEVITDFEGRARNWGVALEYQPFGTRRREGPNTIFSYLGTPIGLGPYFFLTVAPKMRVEYRGRLEGADDPIFAENNEVLRYGPSVTLNIDGDRAFPDHVPWWAQRLHYQLTYGYLADAFSSATYRYFDTSLTFNLDPGGHLGLTLSYRRGELETTGKSVDIAKIALSAKFGED